MPSTTVSAAAIRGEAAAPQFMRALEEANRIRLARADIKRGLAAKPDHRSSLLAAAELLEQPPEVLHSMRIVDLLKACRRIGPLEARKLLVRVPVSEWRPVGALTDRQRRELIDTLRCSA
jgi:hypothetical protein